MGRTKNRALPAGRRGRIILSVLVAGVLVGSVGAQGSFAAAKRKDPGTCVLSQNAAGDLVATGSGFTGGTMYQYEVYSGPKASVGGGNVFTDASGSFTDDLGPMSFYMNVYPGETTLTFDMYPIIGNKAVMTSVAASCTYTP
jgi:hypothetical protein